jgi:hypothetical protein
LHISIGVVSICIWSRQSFRFEAGSDSMRCNLNLTNYSILFSSVNFNVESYIWKVA